MRAPAARVRARPFLGASAVCLAVATLLSCGDETPLGPSAGRDPPDQPVLAADGAGDGDRCIPGQLRATLPAGTSAAGSGTVALGQVCDPLVYAGDSSFERPMQMEFRAQGLIKFYRSDYQHLWGDNKGKYWFDADPGGACSWAFGCDTNVGLEFTEESFWGRWFSFRDEGWLPDQEVWVDTIVVKGSGVARRQRGPAGSQNMANYPCDFPPNWPEPCFTITGTHTVTLTPMATKLQLAASRTTVLAGDPVTFTASTIDGTGFDVVEWIWVPDQPADGGPVLMARIGDQREPGSGSATLYADGGPPICVGPTNPCTEPMLQSGTMYVRAVIHWAAGTVEQASVHVDVIPCPTGDSLLDTQWVRDSLRQLLRDSRPDAAADTLKVEQAAFFLRDRTTGALSFHRAPADSANNCMVQGEYEFDPQRHILVALVHTHPYAPGDIILFCGSRFAPLTYRSVGSLADWMLLIDANAQVRPFQTLEPRMYVIDKVNVITLDYTAFWDPTKPIESIDPHTSEECSWWQ
ncbi:MAG: hypothetical protein ACREON_00820 [Gemmatimonadaceae bacterium]